MEKNKKRPAIRFKGFDDDWEQRKLGDVAYIYDGVHQTPKYTDSGIMFLSVEDIHFLKSKKYISVEDFNRDYRVYPQKGDILMTRIGDVGTPNVVRTNEKIAFYVSLALLKPINTDSFFLCNSILSPHFKRGLKERTLITAVPQKINKDEIGKIDAIIPNSIQEQQSIGKLFLNLDNLITLHQRKLEKLKNVKKAMLEKMFPAEGTSVPAIRFKGFDNAWEQRKLGNIVTRIVRKNENNETNLPLTISAEYGLVDQITFFNNRVASSNLTGYYLLYNGDFAYNKSTSSGAPWGTIKRLELYDKGAVSTLYIAFKPLNDVNSTYLLYHYETNRWHKEIRQIAAEGARNHGLLNISADDFFATTLNMPSLEEQGKIGEVLSKFSSLITLHQRKLEKLQNIKKAMLEKMFV